MPFVCADVTDTKSKNLPKADAIVAVNLLHVCREIRNAVACIAEMITRNRAIAVLTWPTDKLNHLSMFALDIKSGWSFGKSLKAAALRWRVGISGGALGVRKNTHAEIMQAINRHLRGSIRIKSECVLENCQHIVVLAFEESR